MKSTLCVVPGVLEAAKEQVSLGLGVLPSLRYDAAQGGLDWRRGFVLAPIVLVLTLSLSFPFCKIIQDNDFQGPFWLCHTDN